MGSAVAGGVSLSRGSRARIRTGQDDEAKDRVRVVVVDDDPLARRGVRDVLEHAGAIVIAEAPDGRAGVELALHYEPEIVFVDLMMPGMDGIEVIRRIREGAPATRCILLSVRMTASDHVEALKAGAQGFLCKHDLAAQMLPRVLEAAMRGELVCSRRGASDLVEELLRAPRMAGGLRPVRSPLTSREWEVLDLLCTGRSTEEICDELVVSTETVRSHIKNLTRKLGVNSRQEAVDKIGRLRERSGPDVQWLEDARDAAR